ncbi:DgyrCDS1946 [Dimorphilus gyrociliatus]|uniref:DgyrCDS1946 n=1 Tax=Dimorphilus gyrociliatus TaxID=2664684 RepID=A0A7I8VA62_9ANNE|nr:DgyrCDS1946 [Dimorphilus gyrociliatus]
MSRYSYRSGHPSAQDFEGHRKEQTWRTSYNGHSKHQSEVVSNSFEHNIIQESRYDRYPYNFNDENDEYNEADDRFISENTNHSYKRRGAINYNSKESTSFHSSALGKFTKFSRDIDYRKQDDRIWGTKRKYHNNGYVYKRSKKTFTDSHPYKSGYSYGRKSYGRPNNNYEDAYYKTENRKNFSDFESNGDDYDIQSLSETFASGYTSRTNSPPWPTYEREQLDRKKTTNQLSDDEWIPNRNKFREEQFDSVQVRKNGTNHSTQTRCSVNYISESGLDYSRKASSSTKKDTLKNSVYRRESLNHNSNKLRNFREDDKLEKSGKSLSIAVESEYDSIDRNSNFKIAETIFNRVFSNDKKNTPTITEDSFMDVDYRRREDSNTNIKSFHSSLKNNRESKNASHISKTIFNDKDKMLSYKKSQSKHKKGKKCVNLQTDTNKKNLDIDDTTNISIEIDRKNRQKVYRPYDNSLRIVKNKDSDIEHERKVEKAEPTAENVVIVSPPKTNETFGEKIKISRKYDKDTGKITNELKSSTLGKDSPVEVILSPFSTANSDDYFFQSLVEESNSLKEGKMSKSSENKISQSNVWKRLGNRKEKADIDQNNNKAYNKELKKEESYKTFQSSEEDDSNEKANFIDLKDVLKRDQIESHENKIQKLKIDSLVHKDLDLRCENVTYSCTEKTKYAEESKTDDISKNLQNDNTSRTIENLSKNNKLKKHMIYKCINCEFYTPKIEIIKEHLRTTNHYSASTYEAEDSLSNLLIYRVKSQFSAGGIFETIDHNTLACLKGFCEEGDYLEYPILPDVEFIILSCEKCNFIETNIDKASDHLEEKECADASIECLKVDKSGNSLETLFKLDKKPAVLTYRCQECNYVSECRNDGIQHVLSTRHERMKRELRKSHLEMPSDTKLGCNVIFAEYREALLLIVYNRLRKELKEVKADESIKVAYKCHCCNFFSGSSQSLLNHLKQNCHVSGCEMICKFGEKGPIPIFAKRNILNVGKENKMEIFCPECYKLFKCIRDCSDHFLTHHEICDINYLFGCYSVSLKLEEKRLEFSSKACETCETQFENHLKLIEHWKEYEDHTPGFKSNINGKVELWQKKVDEHKEKQLINPFSEWEGAGHREKLSINDANYGKPVEGSFTEKRANQAKKLITSEIEELCLMIESIGNQYPDGWIISFRAIFEAYTKISSKVVGLLLRARKQGLVRFEGEMLFQRRDDSKEIKLVENWQTLLK